MARQRSNSARQQFWGEVMGRWRQSGKSVRQFCRDEGLREPSFYLWRRALAAGGNRATAIPGPAKRVTTVRRTAEATHQLGHSTPATAFLPVHLAGGAADEDGQARGGVEIVLSPTRRVLVQPGFDRKTLAEVLAVLEARPC